MQSALLFAALATSVLAAPHAKRATCTFSPFEAANLLHGHDVNTGKIKAGKVIIESGIVFNGSKCSPAWAVGGAIDDATPTVFTGTVKEISAADLSKLLGPLAGSTQGDLAGLLGTLGGAGVTDVSGLLKGLGGAGGAAAPATGDLTGYISALGGAKGLDGLLKGLGGAGGDLSGLLSAFGGAAAPAAAPAAVAVIV